jgi:PAS domain S-box-containing protein
MLRSGLIARLRLLSGLLCAVALTKPAPRQITIQLKWVPQYQFAGYYAAQHEGLYRAEGLDVAIRPGGKGLDPVKEVLAGRAQFGVGDADLLLARAKGEPIVVLAAVFQHSPYILLTRAQDHITRPSDFIGKTVMALEDQGAAQLRAMLLREGVDPGKVHIVPHSWNLQDLAQGRVDAMTAYLTVEPFQLRKLGVAPGIVRPSDYGVDFYGDCLFTTEAEIRDHPDEVEGVLRATRAGWDQAMRQPDQVIPWILDQPGVKARGISAEDLAFEAKAMQPLVLADVVPVGHMNPDRWQHILATYQDLGLIPGRMALKGFLYAPDQEGISGQVKRWLLFGTLGALALLLMGGVWIALLRRAVGARTRELRAEQAHLRIAQHALDEAPDFIWWVDEEGRYLYANKALLGLYRMDFNALRRRRIWDQMPSMTEAGWRARWAEVSAQGQLRTEAILHGPDGREVPVEVASTHMTAEDRPVICHIARDLSEARRAERERMEHAASLALVLEGAGVGYWDWRIQGDALEIDQTVSRLLGYDPGELPTTMYGWRERILHAEDQEKASALALPYLKGAPGLYDHEFRLKRKDGTWIWVGARGRVTERDASGRAVRFQGILQDIDARKRTEAGLQQVQRLESLGLLAGGIAHDFNNLLTAILGNLNLARVDAAPGSRTAEHLRRAEEAVQQAANLSRQMLAYSGKGRLMVGSIDLNALVEQTRDFMAAGLPKDVRLEAHLDPAGPRLEGDSTQIQQVVLNLLTNAVDAIGPRPGTIRISTASVSLKGGEPMRFPPGAGLPAGDYVQLGVSDTGEGMGPEVQARIFDPFFTTKATGRGLGLSALLGIIRGHRGGIQLESAPGAGTAFRIYFPRSSAAPAQTPSGSQAASTALSGTILLADDEPAVLEAGRALLESLGFTVLAAEDGESAIAAFLDHQDDIRLVILDQTMPRLSGTDTFRAIRRLRPRLPVILSSGFSEEEVGDTLRAEGLEGFLQKPYRLKDLERTVREVLGA